MSGSHTNERYRLVLIDALRNRRAALFQPLSLSRSPALPLPRLRIRSNRMESDFLPFELRPPPPPPVAHLEFLPLIPLTYHYSPSRQNFSSPTVFCTKLMPICLWLLFRKSFPRSTRVEKDLVQFQLLMQIETY